MRVVCNSSFEVAVFYVEVILFQHAVQSESLMNELEGQPVSQPTSQKDNKGERHV
jgi:hypothetical protein